MSTAAEFSCDRCGACCRQVDHAPETIFLDRGDGVCCHYDEDQRLCSIYEWRPAICRVEHQYFSHYRHLIDWPKFVRINQSACEILKSRLPE